MRLSQIPAAVVTPAIPALEQARLDFQRPLLRGWGAWMPSNYLELVSLPDSSTITIGLCHAATANVSGGGSHQATEGVVAPPQQCFDRTVGPDDRCAISCMQPSSRLGVSLPSACQPPEQLPGVILH